jgi:hypothetical protein
MVETIVMIFGAEGAQNFVHGPSGLSPHPQTLGEYVGNHLMSGAMENVDISSGHLLANEVSMCLVRAWN